MEQIERIDYPALSIDTTGSDAVGNRADELPPDRRTKLICGFGPAFWSAGPSTHAPARFPGYEVLLGGKPIGGKFEAYRPPKSPPFYIVSFSVFRFPCAEKGRFAKTR